MTVGLTLGKYAPFHRGHQHVVETAFDEVDELIVLIYDCPDTTDVPLSVRADWIRDLYPGRVEVVEGWTLPTDHAHGEREKQRKHEEAVIGALDGQNVDAFYSSEPYGEHMSEALDAEDRRVDQSRNAVPISGTKIRNATYENRKFVDDRVYRDLVTNVAIMGAPSTGKSTLARALAEAYDTEWMPEHGREYWEEHETDGELTREQLVELAKEHIEREDERLTEADKYLFTDTNAITTLLFSHRYHGDAHPRLEELARENAFRYDVVFLCGTDIPYEPEEGRGGPDMRQRMQKQTRAYLDRHGISYTVLTGSVDERMATVESVLDGFQKYDMER